MRPVRLVLTAFVAVAVLVGGAPAAHAADLRFEAGAAKVVVNQSYENIPWSLQGADVWWIDSADAYLEHAATRETGDLDFVFEAPFRGTFRFYDWERMGTYRIYGSAYDWDYNEYMPLATSVVVKREASVALGVSRAKRVLTLTATAKKYTGSYPTWAGNRGAKVRFEQRVGSRWRTVATRTVSARGTAVARMKLPVRTYRAVVLETGDAWGAHSAVRTR